MTPHRILLVEDNLDGCMSLCLLLTLIGHEVDAAHDGVEGIAHGIAAHPDVAIVDINLPKADGFEVARRLRTELGAGARLIAYTSQDRWQIQDQASAAGFDAIYTKPNDLLRLVAAAGE